jgi:hypothetical protein
MKRRQLSPEAEAIYLTPLPPEEFERRLAIALAELEGEELENVASHIRWFCRRYPTPQERLAYARRAYARWTKGRDAAPLPCPPEPVSRPRAT